MKIVIVPLMAIIKPVFTISGDKPGMVDYMIWPWSDRLGVVKSLAGEKFVLPNERFPTLVLTTTIIFSFRLGSVTGYLIPALQVVPYVKSEKQHNRWECTNRPCPANSQLVSTICWA
jgi:hypothetical protein